MSLNLDYCKLNKKNMENEDKELLGLKEKNKPQTLC